MSDVLIKIKRAVLENRYMFSFKARIEMKADEITEQNVLESIMEARGIAKKIRSRSPERLHSREYLYVIKSFTWDGLAIYAKGKFLKEGDREVFYLLISSKRDLS